MGARCFAGGQRLRQLVCLSQKRPKILNGTNRYGFAYSRYGITHSSRVEAFSKRFIIIWLQPRQFGPKNALSGIDNSRYFHPFAALDIRN